MNVLTRTLAALAVTALLSAAATAGDASDYLTKDGTLKETLTVKSVQGGFAGFTGKAWVIEPNGDWKIMKVFNEKMDVESKGTLTKEQLATLAKELAKYEAAGLENKEVGKPMANPAQVTIKWGKKEATLTLGTGESPPKPDNASVPGRFGGVVAVVTDLAKGK